MRKSVNLVHLSKSSNEYLVAKIWLRYSHLIFIILAASRDLIFTERSSPGRHLLSLPRTGRVVAVLSHPWLSVRSYTPGLFHLWAADAGYVCGCGCRLCRVFRSLLSLMGPPPLEFSLLPPGRFDSSLFLCIS